MLVTMETDDVNQLILITVLCVRRATVIALTCYTTITLLLSDITLSQQISAILQPAE